MENEYGISVANKYALFYDEKEEDILKLQLAKAPKKAEKTKKNSGKEKENKSSAGKQNGPAPVSQEKKSDKVDQFSSPTVTNESGLKVDSGHAEAGSNTQHSGGEGNRDNRSNRAPRGDRTKPRPSSNRESRDPVADERKCHDNRSDRPDNRPPRIRARDGPGRYNNEKGRPREPRQDRPDQEGTPVENTERADTIGYFERPDQKQRNGGDQVQRSENRERFSGRRPDFGERTDRDRGGGSGRGFYRGRGGFRGRGRFDRNQFSDRPDQDRPSQERSGFDEHPGELDQRPQRDGFSDNDGGNFMERPEKFDQERNGFSQRRDFRGRRGGRGRGGFDRPPRRNYQRYGDRQQRQQHQSDGPSNEPASDEQNPTPADAEFDSNKPQEGISWAEQIDAAEANNKNDGVQGDEEDVEGGDVGNEPQVMTLDEWKAHESAKRAKAEFNIRKAGEGVSSDPQWKKMVVLSKKERPDAHEEDEQDEEEQDHHASKAKNVIPIEIHFTDDAVRGGRGRGSGRRGFGGGPRGGSGGGGGRGGGRGRDNWGTGRYGDNEQRGGGREPRGRAGYGYNESRVYNRSRGGRRENTPNFADESDFPSLVSNAQP